MSAGLISVVTLCYLGVAFDQLRLGNFGMALVWSGYAIANVGLIWSMK